MALIKLSSTFGDYFNSDSIELQAKREMIDCMKPIPTPPQTKKSNLIPHFEKLKPVFSEFGDVYFAGGCVRDHLLNRVPRDYDLFILAPGTRVTDLRSQYARVKHAYDLPDADKVVRSSSKYVVRNICIDGDIIQIIWSDKPTIRDLLDSFDWNICQFGYGYDATNGVDKFIYSGDSPIEMVKKKYLKLANPGTIPASCLRRGFIFSERYEMFIDRGDLRRLCQMQLDKLDKEDLEKCKQL